MKRLVILGGGESGVGAAILGKQKGYEIFVSDSGSIAKKYKKVLLHHEINFEEHQHSTPIILNADLVVKSPGIPDNVSIVKYGVFPEVITDRVQIRQVFQNLIENAIKHNNNETVEISISYDDTNENQHVFKVSDNGTGISSKYFDKIFKLFQKLEDQTSNASIGMGLPVAKKNINRNGGEIGIEKSSTNGTTFYFTLPKKSEIEKSKLKMPNVRVV